VAHRWQHPDGEARIGAIALSRPAQQMRLQLGGRQVHRAEAEDPVHGRTEVTHGVTAPARSMAIRPE
jgi:hypothetical protein